LGNEFVSFFWVFIFIIFFLPLLQQKWLAYARKKFISKLERDRGSRVIVLLHRQEFLSLFGFPFFKYISIEDSEQILRAIRKTDPQMPIDLILHTPGGLVLAATQIANALRKHPGQVNVIVPHYAMSGGTLLALAADQIIMSDTAVLGPVDPQIDRYPAVSIIKAVEQKPISEIEDKTLILADQAKKAMSQMKVLVTNLLTKHMDAEAAKNLGERLTSGEWTHDYPFTFEEAQGFGLKVSSDIPEMILELMELYPQPTRRQANVEYSPEERRKKSGNS